jgi:hypothetical protein
MPGNPAIALPSEYVMLTIFLKHDQSKNLAEINRELDEVNFWRDFPPQGVEIASWYVMMGIGQVVTLKVPPSMLREVNVMMENKAWKPFRTEYYPTYDFREIYSDLHKKALKT